MNILILDKVIWDRRLENDSDKYRSIMASLDFVGVRLGTNKYVIIKNRTDGKAGHTIDKARLDFELALLHKSGSIRYEND